MQFKLDLNESQKEKLEEWKKAHKTIFGEYGGFIYSFDDSGITTSVEITSKLSNQSIIFLV